MKKRKRGTRMASLGLAVAMVLSVIGFMPEKTANAAENEYTNIIFSDDFSDVEVSKTKWATALDIQDGKNVLGLGKHYTMKDQDGAQLQVAGN